MKPNRLHVAIDRLAALYPSGELLAATEPANLLMLAVNEINLRREQGDCAEGKSEVSGGKSAEAPGKSAEECSICRGRHGRELTHACE